ncbi:MAG: pilus assembly protein PilM [Sedimentisphaerales bacterium]|jgi:Tfp pilus assembly PilM family ATPase|nr:pilus assembly protein PilM [Sedimentisphaerales bacterium]HNY78325.1 pilus assembly protein PilM [Sedimentisphaerales bacterium]HOC63587.1 pilus assembly protein PilM [Sedimentisphaerales bacterium]HOH62792.1 pilus assembly protein PilM [Sedimentisphaerales bacterium]HQA91469.1 pilus assembly protein PilM [Sedimentisphaerales bacterium]
MLGILKKGACPIGIDLGYEFLKVAQLATNGEQITVVSCQWMRCAAYDPPDGPQWQRWAIDAICHALANGRFRGKDVVVALPTTELFIEHLKCPQAAEGKFEDAIFSKIRQKMPSGWTRNNTVIKCMPTEQDKILVIAAERAIIDRHLAIYEGARLTVKSMAVWPVAMATCYARLFARPGTAFDSAVMLLDIRPEYTNMVVCRGRNLLLARSIPIGGRQLRGIAEIDTLTSEVSALRNRFLLLYGDVQIERLIFLSGPAIAPEVCRIVGADLSLRAQLGDCQVALGMQTISDGPSRGDEVQTSWALAFGLSLS